MKVAFISFAVLTSCSSGLSSASVSASVCPLEPRRPLRVFSGEAGVESSSTGSLFTVTGDGAETVSSGLESVTGEMGVALASAIVSSGPGVAPRVYLDRFLYLL